MTKKNNVNEDLTEIVFILDESGSMCDMVEDTIGGFNSTIASQKKKKGECLVSTVCFSNDQRVIHDRINLKDVKKLTNNDYNPHGCTALIDTIALSIKHIKTIHRYIRKEDRPTKTMFIITTDGMENASVKYSLKEVKKMIEDQKEKGWEFIFMAANIDAYETARDFGFEESRTVNYVNDSIGNKVKFKCMDMAITSLRTNGNIEEAFIEVKEDHKKRGKK